MEEDAAGGLREAPKRKTSGASLQDAKRQRILHLPDILFDYLEQVKDLAPNKNLQELLRYWMSLVQGGNDANQSDKKALQLDAVNLINQLIPENHQEVAGSLHFSERFAHDWLSENEQWGDPPRDREEVYAELLKTRFPLLRLRVDPRKLGMAGNLDMIKVSAAEELEKLNELFAQPASILAPLNAEEIKGLEARRNLLRGKKPLALRLQPGTLYQVGGDKGRRVVHPTLHLEEVLQERAGDPRWLSHLILPPLEDWLRIHCQEAIAHQDLEIVILQLGSNQMPTQALAVVSQNLAHPALAGVEDPNLAARETLQEFLEDYPPTAIIPLGTRNCADEDVDFPPEVANQLFLLKFPSPDALRQLELALGA